LQLTDEKQFEWGDFMYSTLFFLHISSLSIWLGGMVTLSMLLYVIRTNEWLSVQSTVATCLKVVNRVLVPSAYVLLITGGVMMMQMGLKPGQKPFWLMFMEQTGGLVILASTIAMALLGRKIRKTLLLGNGSGPTVSELRKAVSNYRLIMVLSGFLVFIVIAVVSMKIT
jgi:putative copper export protein